jgi:hypothetical protein
MGRFTINDAIYKTNGKNDECYTPRYVVEAILQYIPKNKVIWCPFDKEESFFVKVLKENGYEVVFSHIDNGEDFFDFEPSHWDIIVSNPPFSNKRKFFERAFQLGKPFMLLMTAQWLNDAAPVELYNKYNKDMELIHFTKRIQFLNVNEQKIPFKSLFFCNDILPKANILINI